MTLATTGAGRPARYHEREFVSATAMARLLCLDRSYQDKLVDMGVIERRADGKFDLDDNRHRYILHLREERKRSPKSEADTDFQRAKSELIRIRIQEKQRQLINAEEAYAMIDQMVGLFLSGLSGFPARCGGRDLTTRRAIEQAVFDLRRDISEAATKLADQHGEPVLDEV